MTKFPIFKKSNRYHQDVGKVLISRKMGLKISKRPFGTKISLISFFLIFGDPRGGTPIGLLFGRRFFFADTGISLTQVDLSNQFDSFLLHRSGILECSPAGFLSFQLLPIADDPTRPDNEMYTLSAE